MGSDVPDVYIHYIIVRYNMGTITAAVWGFRNISRPLCDTEIGLIDLYELRAGLCNYKIRVSET